eukprot:TRINITY_DN26717_c0_g1_i2.p1 TRINITY_DN26717_c0_g1~~TRINITY_DN26717_c0_g1_i2.p1  ORF type:complete len:102 (-),score=26.06 TRINITY_DN26717_c0_g1_i2:384-689(-)
MNHLVAAWGVYALAKNYLTKENVGDILPEELLGWLPLLLGMGVMAFVSNIQQKQAAKATAALIGQDAPDFKFSTKADGETSLKEIVTKTKLPTVVDFYQNF